MARITFWTPNYAPELTGIPPLVTDAAEWLAARGHEVDAVTPFPNYPARRIDPRYRGKLWRTEVQNGVRIHRSWLRVRPEERFRDKALYELSVAAMSFPNVARLAPKTDALVCLVPTLGTGVIAGGLRRLHATPRFVLWVQDLVLDAAASVQGIAPRTLQALGHMRRLEAATVRAADLTVVCSPGFRDYFRSHGLVDAPIEVIYNWVDVDWIKPVERPAGDACRVLYSGNIGYTQGFETLIDAARMVGDGVVFDVFGDGNAATHVTQLAAGSSNVRVHSSVPREDYPSLLASADVHLVLQRGLVAGANLPSKIGPSLASGRPIVASIDERCAAADLLRASGGALLVPPDDPRALADAVLRLRGDDELRAELGRAGRAYAVANFDKSSVLERFERAVVGNDRSDNVSPALR